MHNIKRRVNMENNSKMEENNVKYRIQRKSKAY